MVDIALYGNITFDTVFEDFEQYKSIGAIANVWDSIMSINNSLQVHLEPIEIGSAIVLIDKNSGEKVSKPKLQLKYNHPTLVNSKWSHIAYINRIRDISFLADLKDTIVSVDIAGKKPFDLEYLRFVDYVFVSDDEIQNLDMMLNLVRGAVIVHSNSGSITYKDGTTIINNHEIVKNINVLGAGDYFAACFIVNMLKTSDVEKSLQESHKKALNYLKNRI